jgi:hypothetical protein
MKRGKSAGIRDVILVRRGEREARVVRIRWHDVFWSIDITASGELRGEMGNGTTPARTIPATSAW